MNVTKLTQDAVLRIGEVAGVDGRKIYVLVDKNKNLSDMFFDGDILRNISVNSYIEIRKGFLSLIGRVEGEKIEEDYPAPTGEEFEPVNRNKRVLTVALAGYIDERGKFTGGTKELPLIGNEAYIVTREKINRVHNLTRDDGSPSIVIASIEGHDFDIEFPIDGLFNSHIAIFGNTGSGKSNTLAYPLPGIRARPHGAKRRRFLRECAHSAVGLQRRVHSSSMHIAQQEGLQPFNARRRAPTSCR